MKKAKEYTCPMCKSQISKKDERCPKCGSVLKKAYSKITTTLYIATALILLLFIIVLITIINEAIFINKLNSIKGTYRLTSDNTEFKEIIYFRKVNTLDDWDSNDASVNYIDDVLITYGVTIYNYNVSEELKDKAFCFKKNDNILKQIKCPSDIENIKEGEMLNLTYEKE